MSRENAYISYPAFVTSSTPARPNLALLGVTVAIARGFRRGQTWERSASLVFNALLVPVSLTVITGNGPFVGIPVLALAIVGIVAALLMNGVDDAA